MRTLHARVSDRSMCLRFFDLGGAAGEKQVTLLMQPASPSHQTLTAWIGTELVGVAGFEGEPARLPRPPCWWPTIVSTQGLARCCCSTRRTWPGATVSTDSQPMLLGENLLALRTLRDLGCTEQVRSKQAPPGSSSTYPPKRIQHRDRRTRTIGGGRKSAFDTSSGRHRSR